MRRLVVPVAPVARVAPVALLAVLAVLGVLAVLAAGLLVLPAPPASAGGPTSVLVVNYDGSRASGALTGSRAYSDLEKALDPYTTPTGDPTAPTSFMGTQLRLTWMIHDVNPWRLDAVTIDGADVWIETTVDESGGGNLFETAGVRHRPKDADLLVETLTTLGVYGPATATARPTPTATAPVVTGPAPAAAVAASAPGGEPARTGPPWAAALAGALMLGLGIVLGRRARRRAGRPSPSPGG